MVRYTLFLDQTALLTIQSDTHEAKLLHISLLPQITTDSDHCLRECLWGIPVQKTVAKTQSSPQAVPLLVKIHARHEWFFQSCDQWSGPVRSYTSWFSLICLWCQSVKREVKYSLYILNINQLNQLYLILDSHLYISIDNSTVALFCALIKLNSIWIDVCNC